MATSDVAMVPVDSSNAPAMAQPTPGSIQHRYLLPSFQLSIVPGAAVPPSVLNSHEADAKANSERIICFLLHLVMLFFTLPLLGLSLVVNYATLPLGLVSLVTCVVALSRVSSLRGVPSGCCCTSTPLGAYSWISGMHAVLLLVAMPALGVCIWITAQWASLHDSAYTLAITLSLTAAVATFATIVCSILAMIKLSALQRICTENWRLPSNSPVARSTVTTVCKLDPLDDGDDVNPLLVGAPTNCLLPKPVVEILPLLNFLTRFRPYWQTIYRQFAVR
jgi:hypothetical protein